MKNFVFINNIELSFDLDDEQSTETQVKNCLDYLTNMLYAECKVKLLYNENTVEWVVKKEQ